MRCACTGCLLCPADPTISNLAAPLTIDTHAHFFNGSDLQIREFLSQTTVGPDSELYPLVNSMGALLQILGWHLAPNAESERAAMARYAALVKQCDGTEQLRRLTSNSFQEGYLLGRQQLQAAADATYQTPAGAAVLGPKAARTGLGAAIADLPATYDEFEERRSNAATVLGSQPTLLGYIQFVLHQFNHRHVNAVDYLTTYSKGQRARSTWLPPAWWITIGGSRVASRPRPPCPIRWT